MTTTGLHHPAQLQYLTYRIQPSRRSFEFELYITSIPQVVNKLQNLTHESYILRTHTFKRCYLASQTINPANRDTTIA